MAAIEAEAQQLREAVINKQNNIKTLERRVGMLELEVQELAAKVGVPAHGWVLRCTGWIPPPPFPPPHTLCAQRSGANVTLPALTPPPPFLFYLIDPSRSGTLRLSPSTLCPRVQTALMNRTAQMLSIHSQNKQGTEEQHRLGAEKAALIDTVKRLNREVSKLEAFKRSLLQHLQEDDEVRPHLPGLQNLPCSPEQSRITFSVRCVSACARGKDPYGCSKVQEHLLRCLMECHQQPWASPSKGAHHVGLTQAHANQECDAPVPFSQQPEPHQFHTHPSLPPLCTPSMPPPPMPPAHFHFHSSRRRLTDHLLRLTCPLSG